MKLPLMHRLYAHLRPTLYDWGLLHAARRLLSQKTRTGLAATLGLSGFDTGSAPGNRLSRWQQPADIRKNPNWQALTGVTYLADLRADLGLSELSRLIVQTLQGGKLLVKYIEVPYRFESRTQPPPKLSDPGSIYPICIVDQNIATFYEALMTMPPDFWRDKYLIAVWSWELEDFPAKWWHNFRFVNEIWVSSRYTQAAIAAAAPVPVVRVPFGIEIPPVTKNRAHFNLPDDRYIFFYAFSSTSTAARKNPFGFIEAFQRAFPNLHQMTNPPLLVLKIHHSDHPDAHRLTPALEAAVAAVNGRLITQNLTRQAMYTLIASCDCVVSLHRAEGFGLLPAEAMTLGKPVIATAYSGNLDYMTLDNSYGVRYTLKEISPDDHYYQPRLAQLYPPGQVWAEPDLDHAAELMDRVYQHPESAAAIGCKAAEDMKKYTYAVCGQRLLTRLERIRQFISDDS